jgi:hypothetical protein
MLSRVLHATALKNLRKRFVTLHIQKIKVEIWRFETESEENDRTGQNLKLEI